MSDFHQRDLITTLPRLRSIETGSRESCLEKWSASSPIGLILPCTASDFFAPAMQQILRELSTATYLSRIVISLNQAGAADVLEAQKRLAALPDRRLSLLWNDHPELPAHLLGIGIPSRGGKGFNVWTALGFLMARADCKVAVTHDCDILHYRSEMVASLVYPLLHPGFGYDFAKGYYPRFSEDAGGQLFGRATRLFMGPLLRAIGEVAGYFPLIHFLEDFRYALSGEIAGRLSWLGSCHLAAGWALEIDLLCSAHRHLSPEQVVQVDLGHNYEHRHRLASPDGAEEGLPGLAREIANALFENLAREGVPITPGFLSAMQVVYARNARETIRRYRHVAEFNGLAFSENEEFSLVDTFTKRLSISPPPGLQRLPAWIDLRRSHPAWCTTLFQLIEVSASTV